MSVIRAGDAVVIDTRKRDQRLRIWCKCMARQLRKQAKDARAHADRLTEAAERIRAVGEALREG